MADPKGRKPEQIQTTKHQDAVARRYAMAMKADLLRILSTKHPEVHKRLTTLPPPELEDQLWRHPEVRPMLTDMMLHDLGFYVGAKVQNRNGEEQFQLTGLRVSHDAAGAPEFIQLYGESLAEDANEASKRSHYLGHIHEYVSLETQQSLLTPEDLGVSQP